MKPSLSFLLLGACLVTGCIDLDADESPDTAVRSEGPLTAPRGASFGRVRAGGTSNLDLALENTGRSEIIVRRISVVPPDPYDTAFVPAEPCVPPDPYRNPPAFLTTRLIAPCVMPAGATTLAVAFAPRENGGYAAGISVEYATADGHAYTLTIPATACVVR